MGEYEKAIRFLQESIHLFRDLKIGGKSSWKPVQTGLVMATTTILQVQEDLLSQGHKFVLTSRFTQDFLENTFGCIRQRNPVPTPVEFSYGLRAVTVGQFLSTVHTGSYLDDSCDHLADFLETKTITSSPEGLRVEQLVDLTSPPTFTKTDSCVLYHLAGYIVKCVFSSSLCEICKHALVQNKDDAHENAVLLQLKEFKQGALYRPSDEVFTVIQHVEQLFRSRTDDSLIECTNAVEHLEQEAMLLDRKIICKYVRLRLRIAATCIRAARREDKSKG